MASVSSSHLILFIASLIVAAGVAGTFTNGVQRLSGALGERSVDVSTDVRTDIEIISDSAANTVYDDANTEITVLVKNTGSEDLDADPAKIDVLANGQYQTDITVTVVDGSQWRVGNVIRIKINEELQSGDHRVTVIVNGDREVFEFRT